MRFVLGALFVLLIPLLPTSRAHALGFVATAGFADAGRNLSEITGGQNYEIGAGRSVLGLLGVTIPMVTTDLHNFDLQLDTGYTQAGDYRPGDENHATWSHWPIELLYFYRNARSNFRVGYGPIAHFANWLVGMGSTAAITTKFEDAYGWTIVVDKMVAGEETWALGLKYNSVRYHSSKYNVDVDGSAVLVTISAMSF